MENSSPILFNVFFAHFNRRPLFSLNLYKFKAITSIHRKGHCVMALKAKKNECQEGTLISFYPLQC